MFGEPLHHHATALGSPLLLLAFGFPGMASIATALMCIWYVLIIGERVAGWLRAWRGKK